MDDILKKVEEIARDYVKEVKKHVRVNKAFLYGSYAKGTYDEGSDLDIAIFSESFKDKKFVEVTAFLFSLARRYKEICIEPVGFSDIDMISDNPFIKEIIDTGKDISIH
ncbi:MAG: nucleotidyltransferase domain-containing protein [Firmicutes bacterium]|nr:nucleotidyltransferase domain-containing protein [Bacillota bacterium]